jgi:hypothetical protein
VTVHDVHCIKAVFSHLNSMTQMTAVASLQAKVISQLLTHVISSPVGEAAATASSAQFNTTVAAALEELCACLQPSVMHDVLQQALRPSTAEGVAPSPLCMHRTFILRQSSVRTHSFFSALLELLLAPTRPPHNGLPSLQRLADMAREAAMAAMETQGVDMFLRAVALVDHIDHVISHTQPSGGKITTAWLAALLPPSSQQQSSTGSVAQFVQLTPTNQQAVFAVYALSELIKQPLLSSQSLTRIAAAIKPLHTGLKSSLVNTNASAPAVSTQVADAVREVWQFVMARNAELEAAAGKKSSPVQARHTSDFLMAASGAVLRPVNQASATDDKIGSLVIRLVPHVGLQGHVVSSLRQLDAALKIADVNAHIAALHTNMRAALHTAAVQGEQPYSVVLALLASGLASLLSRAAKSHAAGELGDALVRIRLIFTPVVLEGSEGFWLTPTLALEQNLSPSFNAPWARSTTLFSCSGFVPSFRLV